MASHATTALSSLVLVGGVFEAVRRGAASAVRAYADVETGLVGVAKTADLTDAELARLARRIADLSLTPEVGQTRVASLRVVIGLTGFGDRLQPGAGDRLHRNAHVDDLTRFTATIAKFEGAAATWPAPRRCSPRERG